MAVRFKPTSHAFNSTSKGPLSIFDLKYPNLVQKKSNATSQHQKYELNRPVIGF